MSDENNNAELPEIDDAVVGEASASDATEEAEKKKSSEAAVAASEPHDLGLIMDVPLRLSVEIGSANLAVREVLALSKGSVVELDRMNGEPADVYANDRLIAHGELTVQEDRVAIRITELISVQSTGN